MTPLWRSSAFWTFLCSDGVHFNCFIKRICSFSPNFVAGEFIRNSVFRGTQRFKTLALLVDFKNVKDIFQPQVMPSFCVFDGCNKCLG